MGYKYKPCGISGGYCVYYYSNWKAKHLESRVQVWDHFCTIIVNGLQTAYNSCGINVAVT